MNLLSLFSFTLVVCSLAAPSAPGGLDKTTQTSSASGVITLTAREPNEAAIPWLASIFSNIIKFSGGVVQAAAEYVNPETIHENLQPLAVEAKNTVQGAKSALENIDWQPANEWVHRAALDIENAISSMDDNAFSRFLKAQSKELLETLQVVQLEDIPKDMAQYILDHPGDAAFYLIDGLVFFYPGLVYGPVLRLLGFGALGHRIRSVAAALQRTYGAAVPAGSMLSKTTSAGMGGSGRYCFASLTRIAAWVTGAVKLAGDVVSVPAANIPTPVEEGAWSEKNPE